MAATPRSEQQPKLALDPFHHLSPQVRDLLGGAKASQKTTIHRVGFTISLSTLIANSLQTLSQYQALLPTGTDLANEFGFCTGVRRFRGRSLDTSARDEIK